MTPPVDDAPARNDEPFNGAEQASVLEWLLKGASPTGACQQLGLSSLAFLATLSTDAGFRQAVVGTFDLLSFNVAAALYQNAMKGSATAQQYWLRLRPPPLWHHEPRTPAGTDELELLPHEELAERHGALGTDLAIALAAHSTAPVDR